MLAQHAVVRNNDQQLLCFCLCLPTCYTLQIVEALQEKLYDLEQSAADRCASDASRELPAHPQHLQDRSRKAELHVNPRLHALNRNTAAWVLRLHTALHAQHAACQSHLDSWLLSCRPPPDVLQQYKAHVRAIADELRQPDLPAYCLRVTAQDRVADGSSGKAAGTASSALQGASRCEHQTGFYVLSVYKAELQQLVAVTSVS